ncbi:hypothetical protein [Bifidobacterium sp. SO1]|uniref:hypothetical protein n=1 Tax=Bifidobacterium sp. SO1 TaxID=2809029 RepID=UPI001BDC72A9|nr:hypothetical protein [Bifidobacterium sp. SO1]MBT1162110.1 hypothetical protein [Bifidobacterium sp. SO1]
MMDADGEQMIRALKDSVLALKRLAVTILLGGGLILFLFLCPASWWVWLLRGIAIGLTVRPLVDITLDYMRAGRAIERLLASRGGADAFAQVFGKEDES